jgi:hypothetical protein
MAIKIDPTYTDAIHNRQKVEPLAKLRIKF